MNYTDAQAAKDNAAFVRGFLHMYDAYNTSDFYITSESYGGHYMPTLAKELVQQRGACWSDKDCSSSYCMNDKVTIPPIRTLTSPAICPWRPRAPRTSATQGRASPPTSRASWSLYPLFLFSP
jgi:hypothetical protein